MAQEPKFIIVIGASAGGLNSVIELIGQLKEDMDVTVLVVIHIVQLRLVDSFINRLQLGTAFKCSIAEHEETIEPRHVYIAVPDRHLLLKDNTIILGDGPHENRWRPSIDNLFRSAAASYSSRVIGILFSGLLYDGTAGMDAIRRSGGTCMVQDPNEAEYPDMILSVLDHMDVDYCVPLEDMGAILYEKTKNGIPKDHHVPDDVRMEASLAEKSAVSLSALEKIGKKSDFSCPDCGGGLWETTNEEIVHYRCHVGHSFTEEELNLRQNEALENTLWMALRMMEERKYLLDKMAREELSKGWKKMAENKLQRSDEMNEHIERLRQLLFQTKKL